ncbi:hypothetical protein GQ600_12820 [Phytophthora cactorum]|nr:hypothetical protein GQ600_12820 [Phytophthora cactorum]
MTSEHSHRKFSWRMLEHHMIKLCGDGEEVLKQCNQRFVALKAKLQERGLPLREDSTRARSSSRLERDTLELWLKVWHKQWLASSVQMKSEGISYEDTNQWQKIVRQKNWYHLYAKTGEINFHLNACIPIIPSSAFLSDQSQTNAQIVGITTGLKSFDQAIRFAFWLTVYDGATYTLKVVSIATDTSNMRPSDVAMGLTHHTERTHTQGGAAHTSDTVGRII